MYRKRFWLSVVPILRWGDSFILFSVRRLEHYDLGMRADTQSESRSAIRSLGVNAIHSTCFCYFLSTMTTLWVGGTSALAATFFEEQLDIATGHRRSFVLAAPPGQPPERSWRDDLSRSGSRYVPLDMTCRSSIDAFFAALREQKVASSISTIIFGMRASLIAGRERDHLDLTTNISYFLDTASVYFPELVGVIHVSSVAVMNHTQSQCLVNENAPFPPLSSYWSPYDVMKRTTEDQITEACKRNNLKSVQLRISGIFSNELGHRCIQMSAIRLQAYIGCYNSNAS